VASLPHLNDLAAQFQDRPIDFVFVNLSESAAVVSAFLQQHRILGVVGIEGLPKASEVYKIDAIPATVLVSPEGRVAAIGHPLQVNAQVLNSLMTRGPVQLLPSTHLVGWAASMPFHHRLMGGKPIADENSLLKVVASLSSSTADYLIASADQFEASGAHLKTILAYAYGLNAFQVDVPESMVGERYDVLAWVPKDSSEMLKPLVQQSMQAAGALQITRERREVNSLMLRGVPGKLTPAPASELFTYACDKGTIKGDAVRIDVIKSCIESLTAMPVVIDANDTGTYKFSLHWDPSAPKAFEMALENQLGLSLTPVRRENDVLVVHRLHR
jgi:uncharacterized protein (TIGR03435 family)